MTKNTLYFLSLGYVSVEGDGKNLGRVFCERAKGSDIAPT